MIVSWCATSLHLYLKFVCAWYICSSNDHPFYQYPSFITLYFMSSFKNDLIFMGWQVSNLIQNILWFANHFFQKKKSNFWTFNPYVGLWFGFFFLIQGSITIAKSATLYFDLLAGVGRGALGVGYIEWISVFGGRWLTNSTWACLEASGAGGWGR